MIRGHAPDQRRILHHERSRPIIDDLRSWLDAQLTKVSGRSRIAEAIRYALKLWSDLAVFLDAQNRGPGQRVRGNHDQSSIGNRSATLMVFG